MPQSPDGRRLTGLGGLGEAGDLDIRGGNLFTHDNLTTTWNRDSDEDARYVEEGLDECVDKGNTLLYSNQLTHIAFHQSLQYHFTVKRSTSPYYLASPLLASATVDRLTTRRSI